ncbi:MAG: hypothetical protein ACREAC_30415, partial [Blastocatellia bacterium]
SPLPELRQVAVVTQDHLAAAPTFGDAMNRLFPSFNMPGVLLAQSGQGGAGPGSSPGGQVLGLPSQAQPQVQQSPNASANAQPPAAQPTPGATPNGAGSQASVAALTRQAQQLMSDYGRLTADGKYKEAGDKLSQLKATLDELAKRGGG